MIQDSRFKKKEKNMFVFWGKVVGGKKRGKNLGYPTANIALHKNIPEGIYAAKVTIHSHPRPDRGSKQTDSRIRENDNNSYIAATFIGAAKTFGEKEKKAESFLLDFEGNLYGKWVTVRLYKKIRENKKFNSEKELIEQMEKDIKETKEFFTL